MLVIYGEPNKKCERCRFKSDNIDTCTNISSEYGGNNINDIPTHDCTHFFSSDDTENLSNQDVDTKSDFMLYDLNFDNGA